MNKRMTKYWALKKWRWIKYNWENIENFKKLNMLAAMPELSGFIAECSYCQVFINNDCKNCPIKLNDKACNTKEHPYNKWRLLQDKEPTKQIISDRLKYVNQMIYLIKSHSVDREKLYFRNVKQKKIDNMIKLFIKDAYLNIQNLINNDNIKIKLTIENENYEIGNF